METLCKLKSPPNMRCYLIAPRDPLVSVSADTHSCVVRRRSALETAVRLPGEHGGTRTPPAARGEHCGRCSGSRRGLHLMDLTMLLPMYIWLG